MRNTILTTAATALLATSALISASQAAPTFMFRYVSGGASVASAKPVEPTEPETPQPPQQTTLDVSGGVLTHFDGNGNGLIDAGDRVSATWTLANVGAVDAKGVGATAVFLIEDRSMGWTSWNSAPTALSCPATIAPGAKATCAASIDVTGGMLPSSRANAVFSANFGISSAENVENFTGDSNVEALPLGSEMLAAVSNVRVTASPTQFSLGETFKLEFDVGSANGDPISDFAFQVRLPEWNGQTINAMCVGNRCTASTVLTPPVRNAIYAGFPTTYEHRYEVIQTKMGGYPSNKNMTSAAYASGPLFYSNNPADIKISGMIGPGDTLDDPFIVALTIGNRSGNFIKDAVYDIDFGYGIIVSACSNFKNMTPNQPDTPCNARASFTEAQKTMIRLFHGGQIANMSPRLILRSINGSIDGTQLASLGSFIVPTSP